MPILILLSLLLLSACQAGLNLGQYSDINASKDDFIYCHGYGCSQQVRIGFNNHEWGEITEIFTPPAPTATDERAQIGEAIALMEQYTAALAGTQDDLPQAPYLRQSLYELDCIDETVNTTKFLGFLAEARLLHHHKVGRPAFRGLMRGMYPHNTATVVERETGTAYVIDSYIHKNASMPDIRPLKDWHKIRLEDME